MTLPFFFLFCLQVPPPAYQSTVVTQQPVTVVYAYDNGAEQRRCEAYH